MKYQQGQILLIAPEILNTRSMPCVGLGYIGAYLASKGISVRIIDSQFRKEDPFEPLRKSAPTLVGIAVESRTIDRGLRIARFAKAHGHTTLLGGLHVSLIKEEMMQRREVDYAIGGDGEIPAYQLVRALDGERSLDSVSGLIFRRNDGTVQVNPNITEAQDLDELPPPDYRLAGIRSINVYPVVTSRDCPYKCNYCTVGQISHGRFRPRTAAGAVEEILMAKERYGIRSFIVVDENFAFRMDRAVEFCELLISRKVNLPWTAFEGIRTESLNEKFLTLLKAAGCQWVFFGIETVENAVLKSVRKGNRFLHIERAANLARAQGFKVGGFLIIGLPDSSFETDMRTVDWALRHLDKCTFWTAIPYRGTALYQWVQKNGRLLRSPTGPLLINTLSTMPFFETDNYLAHERKRAHTIANLRSGVRYFVDFLDYESRQRLSPERQNDQYLTRRLVQLVCRYDPSFLPRIVPDRNFPEVEDPIVAALHRDEAADFQPLPNDMLGGMATPTHAGLHLPEQTPFRILEDV